MIIVILEWFKHLLKAHTCVILQAQLCTSVQLCKVYHFHRERQDVPTLCSSVLVYGVTFSVYAFHDISRSLWIPYCITCKAYFYPRCARYAPYCYRTVDYTACVDFSVIRHFCLFFVENKPSIFLRAVFCKQIANFLTACSVLLCFTAFQYTCTCSDFM